MVVWTALENRFMCRVGCLILETRRAGESWKGVSWESS